MLPPDQIIEETINKEQKGPGGIILILSHCWKLEDGNNCIEWTMEKPAPDAMLEFVSCNCKKNKC